MAKQKTVLYLNPELAWALREYQRRHRERFRSVSAAADHLLQRALADPVDTGLDDLLAPVIARGVRDAAAGAVAGQLVPLLTAQTERLAGLLVRMDRDCVAAGKDAATAASLIETVVAHLLGERVRDIAADARLRAGATYARRARGVGGEQ